LELQAPRLNGLCCALTIDAFEGGQILADAQAALTRARHDDLSQAARHHPAGALWRASAAALLLDADARLPLD
jgi:hypothetical protein